MIVLFMAAVGVGVGFIFGLLYALDEVKKNKKNGR